MLGLVARHWWVFAIRGIAAIVFGILAFIWPAATLAVLVILFGAYVLVDGASLLVALVRGDAVARRHAWAVAITGVLGIVAGVVTFVWPGLTALSLLYVVAFWAIAMGIFQVIAAVALRRELDGEFWLALGGVVSVVFGALLVVFPGAGLLSLVWLVGIWAVVFGFSSLGLAYRLHKIDAAAAQRRQVRGGALIGASWPGSSRGLSYRQPRGRDTDAVGAAMSPLPPLFYDRRGQRPTRARGCPVRAPGP